MYSFIYNCTVSHLSLSCRSYLIHTVTMRFLLNWLLFYFLSLSFYLLPLLLPPYFFPPHPLSVSSPSTSFPLFQVLRWREKVHHQDLSRQNSFQQNLCMVNLQSHRVRCRCFSANTEQERSRNRTITWHQKSLQFWKKEEGSALMWYWQPRLRTRNGVLIIELSISRFVRHCSSALHWIALHYVTFYTFIERVQFCISRVLCLYRMFLFSTRKG